MNSDNEPDITTTPAESKPDELGQCDSGSDAAVEGGTNGGRTQTPGETARKTAGEIDGRTGPDPARYGDWEKNGRCIDF